MATVSRQNEALLTDKITVQLSKEDYFPAFEKSLKTYSKQAKIPGFRPGMVPMQVVKKMYGSSVFTEEVLRTVEKEINGYLEQEKPEIFAQPLPSDDNGTVLRQMDMNQPGEYSFSFEIGLKPSYEVADLKTATITRRKVEVTPEMLEEEISRLQTRYGNMKDLDTVENDECVLNLTFTEVDAEGNTVEGGVTKDNSLLVNYFTESIRPQLSQLKKDDSIVIKLEEAFEPKEREWVISDLGLAETEDALSKSFRLTVTKIGFVEKRELNEEFFEQLFPGKGVTTIEAFREGVKADIEGYWEQQGKGQVHDEIFHYLVDNTKIDFPESFLKRWLLNGGEKPKTPEEVEAEFPGFINSLRWNLISDRLIEQNNLSIEPEELRDFAKQQMMGHMGITTMDESTSWLDAYVDRMMKDKKYIDQTYHQLLTNKVFAFAETQVGNYKEELMSVDEFVSKQHHHHY
ncbi:MAG: trigger factor [Bacteroidota bacterium]